MSSAWLRIWVTVVLAHHEVHFFALSNPAKPLAVPTLVQELRRVQAGDRSASYTLFPGPMPRKQHIWDKPDCQCYAWHQDNRRPRTQSSGKGKDIGG